MRRTVPAASGWGNVSAVVIPWNSQWTIRDHQELGACRRGSRPNCSSTVQVRCATIGPTPDRRHETDISGAGSGVDFDIRYPPSRRLESGCQILTPLETYI